jgi:hypothetical protein
MKRNSILNNEVDELKQWAMRSIAKTHTKKRLRTAQKQLDVVKISEYLISTQIEKPEV